MKKTMGIGAKLLIVISLVVGTIFMGVIYIMQDMYIEEIYNRIYGVVNLEAVASRNRIESELRSVQEEAGALSHALGGLLESGLIQSGDVERVLRRLMEQSPALLSVWVSLDAVPWGSGALALRVHRDAGVIRTGPLWGHTPESEKVYKDLLSRPGPALGDPLFRQAAGTTQVLLPAGAPILVGGRRGGFAGVEVSAEKIQDIMGAIDPLNNGYAFLFAGNTIYVTHPNAEQVGKTILEIRPTAQERDADVRAGRRRTELNKALATGLESYFIFEPVSAGENTAPWSIALTVALTALTEGARTAVLLIVGITLLAVILVVGVVFMVLKLMIKPLGSVTHLLEVISTGRADLTVTLPVHSGDEVGRLADSFNGFIAHLGEIVRTVQTASQGMREIGDDLSANMTETSSAIEEITANIVSVKNLVVNQSAGVIETRATLEQMSDNIRALNDRIIQQAASVTESSSAIEEMLANIRSVTQSLERNSAGFTELLKASDKGKTGIEEVVTAMKSIAQESEGLLEANSVIQHIAAQTNLLAMNAAIEAAHAGDAGRGFAVVADEIRKLAETSSTQSKSISTLLKTLKGAIDRVVGTTSNASASFDLIVREVKAVNNQEIEIKNAMQEQSSGSEEVLKALEQINSITSVIQSSASELLSGSQVILDEMTRLNESTHEVSHSMDEMASGAGEINKATLDVVELSLKNQQKIQELGDVTGSFVVQKRP